MTGPALRLVIVTLVWGISFPCTRAWQQAAHDSPAEGLLAGLTLIALRMGGALLVLLLWQPTLRHATWQEHRAGAIVGTAFLFGFILQTWGLSYTTPSLSAFFTCLCSAWVPLLLLLMGQPVQPLTLFGLALGIAGCAVIVEGGWKLGLGEWLTLAASVALAGQMLLLDRLGKAMRAAMLSPAFLFSNALGGLLLAILFAAMGPGLAVWLAWLATVLRDPLLPWLILLLAVLPTALGFHWMNTYQPLISPSRAALIYLLEPFFTLLFSMSIWAITGAEGYDRPSWPLFLGGGLILLGNLLVEVWGAAKRESKVAELPATVQASQATSEEAACESSR
ncbi:MAG: DMT family transporter [Gemmataceae bacterium]